MTKHNKNPKNTFIQNGRIGTHLKNVSEGYKTALLNNVHHVLCHSCVQTSAISVAGTDKEYIEKVLVTVEWDVNNEGNLIGLPLKWAYLLDKSAAWDNLPCHKVDHDLYTRDVNQWLADNIWSSLKGKSVKCDVDTANLVSALNGGSRLWRYMLKKRGKMHGGTKYCWDHRSEASMENVWFIPFSMAPELSQIRRRARPPARPSQKVGSILQIIR